MKNKFILLLVSIFLISSCTGNLKRSENSDEFLIEKKNPLVMPPDINDLPTPKQSMSETQENSDNTIKKVLKSEVEKENNIDAEKSGSLTESIIKKIEN